MNTANASEPISGNKKYQIRARKALPILVRQAMAGKNITYSDLAEELDMPNPRNLNYVLGSIGQCLELLSKELNSPIPPIQCLVVGKTTMLPGEGIGWFHIDQVEFAKLSLHDKRKVVDRELQPVFEYSKWCEILRILDLEPAIHDFSHLIREATKGFGGGESEQHRALKIFVANNPQVIGLGAATPRGSIEHRLPSGDCLDVSFSANQVWTAAEVKSAISSEGDITRGLFQCVKYRAVMEAELLAKSKPQNVRAILVLESSLPQSLVALRNLLGVEVIEGILPTRIDTK